MEALPVCSEDEPSVPGNTSVTCLSPDSKRSASNVVSSCGVPDTDPSPPAIDIEASGSGDDERLDPAAADAAI